VRLIRTYQVPVTQVVIFLQETTDEIAFTEAYINETTHHRYRVIRMWKIQLYFSIIWHYYH
jgi:predicted transposase YdaD